MHKFALTIVFAGALAGAAEAGKPAGQPLPTHEALSDRAGNLYVRIIHTPYDFNDPGHQVRISAALTKVSQAEGHLDGRLRGRGAAQRLLDEAETILGDPTWRPPPPPAPTFVQRSKAAVGARVKSVAIRLGWPDGKKPVPKDPLKERNGDLYIRLMHDHANISHETFATANGLRHQAEELIWKRGSKSKRADEARRLLDQADEVIDEPIRSAMTQWEAAHGAGTQVARVEGVPSEVRWAVDEVNAMIRTRPEEARRAVKLAIDRFKDDQRPGVQEQIGRLRALGM